MVPIEKDQQKKCSTSLRLIPHLEDLYRKDYQKFQRKGLRMSDVNSVCERRIWFEFHNPEKSQEIEPRKVIRFSHGNQIHDLDRQKLQIAGLVMNVEKELYDSRLKLSGHCDGRIPIWKFETVEDGREKTPILEIKTANLYKFQEMERSGLDQGYYDQVQLYMDTAKCGEALVLVHNMDTGHLLEFTVLVDSVRIKQIKKWFRAFGKTLKNSEPSARPHPRDSWQCGYCDYKKHCWIGVPEEPTSPEFKADGSAVPDTEMLESAAKTFLSLKRAEKASKKELEVCRAVIEQYFAASGEKEIAIGDDKIVRATKKSTVYDLDILNLDLEMLRAVSKAQSALIQKAVKDGLIDATKFELSKKIEFGEEIKAEFGKEKINGNVTD